VVICVGAVHEPALDDSAPSRITSSSLAFVVVSEGVLTDAPEPVVPVELTSIGVAGFTPRYTTNVADFANVFENVTVTLESPATAVRR
jgi:hypothetical protein